MQTFQDLIARLQEYWAREGCAILQPLDLEVGAATFHPATFLRAIGKKPWAAAYVQPCRRPTDGRYGENPNRLQHYYQFQVALKPSPDNIQQLYLDSLRYIGVDPSIHDVRFVEDNWESPTLGAWGLGWEVWLNGMEVSQYTYFQQVGGLSCDPVLGELTYGLERLAMGIFKIDNVYDLPWTVQNDKILTYGEVFHQNEVEMSQYNFEEADVAFLLMQFEHYEKECARLIEKKLILPAYELLMKASHVFNLLDARHAISVTERQKYILRVRTLSRAIATLRSESLESIEPDAFNTTAAAPVTHHHHYDLLPVHHAKPSFFASHTEEHGHKHTFLLEIGTEELPPHSLISLSDALKKAAAELLIKVNLNFDPIKVFATPRRLAIQISGLSLTTKSSDKMISGPALNAAFDSEGNPTPATLGFAKKCGVDWNVLYKNTEINKVCYIEKISGEPIYQLLARMIEETLPKLPIAKPMRWGAHATKFVRPVHWIMMLWDEQIIDAKILGHQAGRTTLTHRVLSERKKLDLLHAKDYETMLTEQAFVIPSFEKRKDIIKTQLEKSAAALSATLIAPEELLNEVTGLVEWPVVLTIPFDAKFLSLPIEVLITSMQHHQKCFALKNQDGQLMPYFLTVSNIQSKDEQQVIEGNQRVMQARLYDALFFYAADQKIPLIHHREETKKVLWQAELGSLYDKSERMVALMQHLNVDSYVAQLSQCDLMTNMVKEFPELEGTMGYYYALAQNETIDVAIALKEQYQPRASGDNLPQTKLGQALAIAYRADILVGAFSINQKPTGTKDPYKLRRYALGLIRILSEQSFWTLDLLLEAALKNYPNAKNANTILELKLFMIERLKAWYVDELQMPNSVVQAVISIRPFDDLYDLWERVRALNDFMESPAREALAAANKRVAKILGDDVISTISLNIALLVAPEEKVLCEKLEALALRIQPLLNEKNYADVLAQLATLREPIDAFFDNVHVNVEDEALRQQRIALLTQLRALFLSIADFSCLN